MRRMHAVLTASELWEGEMTGVVVDGVRVLLTRVGGEVHAFLDRCAHLGVPLSEGSLDGKVLTCSAHGWQFDVTTGRGVNPQAARLRPLRVEVEGDMILVDLPAVEERGAACSPR